MADIKQALLQRPAQRPSMASPKALLPMQSIHERHGRLGMVYRIRLGDSSSVFKWNRRVSHSFSHRRSPYLDFTPGSGLEIWVCGRSTAIWSDSGELSCTCQAIHTLGESLNAQVYYVVELTISG
jgi:hypothetical protein